MSDFAKNAGLVFAGMSFSAGITATSLFSVNLVLWAVLTAWAGSLLAFLGFAMIIWAVRPKAMEVEVEEATTADEAPSLLPAP